MKKRKILIAFTAGALLVSAMGTLAWASSCNMENGGYAFLNSDFSDGMKYVDAGTIPGVSGHISSTWLETAYEDGSVTQEQDGPRYGMTEIEHDWEWALDYSSIHSLFYSSTDRYDRCSFGG